jgi:hypothetical protein
VTHSERESPFLWMRFCFISFVIAVLLAAYFRPMNIKGKLLPLIPGGEVGGGEVLAVAEADLIALVQEYNQKVVPAVYQFRNHQLRIEQLVQLKHEMLFDRIYNNGLTNQNSEMTNLVGLSGGTSAKNTDNGWQMFLFTDSTKDGIFRLSLPHGRTWCFFVIGLDSHGGACWFKRKTFLIGRGITLSRACYPDRWAIQEDKNGFVRYILASKYGLCIATDGETGEIHGEIKMNSASPVFRLVPGSKTRSSKTH